MRLTGIASTVCAPLPDWFKWILGTTGKLRCVPCCGIYPEVRPNCAPRLLFTFADAATSAVAIADNIPDTCSDAFAVTHGDTITATFSDTFGDTFGDTFTGTHKSAIQLPISSPSPKCPKFRTPLPPPLPSLSRHLYSHISTLWYTMPKMANTGRASGVIMEETERFIVKYCLIRRYSRNNC